MLVKRISVINVNINGKIKWRTKSKIFTIVLFCCFILSIAFNAYNLSERFKLQDKYDKIKQSNNKLSAKNKNLTSENKKNPIIVYGSGSWSNWFTR